MTAGTRLAATPDMVKAALDVFHKSVPVRSPSDKDLVAAMIEAAVKAETKPASADIPGYVYDPATWSYTQRAPE